jgi:N-methylhydantoinase A
LGKIVAFSFRRGERVEFSVLRREALQAAATFSGPAILLEQTATSYVDIGLRGEVHESGAVIISRDEA